MIYIVYRPDDCPNMFGFRYIWSYSRWFYRMYFLTKHNFRMMEYGDFFKVIRMFFHNLFFNHQYIKIEYNNFFNPRFKKYYEFIGK